MLASSQVPSSGSMDSCWVLVEKGVAAPRIDVVMEKVLSMSRLRGFGAIALFVGIVKPFSKNGREVSGLEVREESEGAIEKIVDEVVKRCRDAEALVYVWHRTGFVRVGEPIMIVCVATKTRGEAFELTRKIVDAFKEAESLLEIERIRVK